MTDTTTRSKTAFSGASRSTIFNLNPLPPSKGGDVIFIGVDTDDGPEHILYSVSQRNETPSPAFADELDERGVIEPITVRKNGPHGELIFGRRRLLGLRLANERRLARGADLRTIPAIKFAGTDAELLEMLIAENSHREDEDPIERARQAVRLLSYRSKAQVARAANVTAQTISSWQKLLETAPKVQDAVRHKGLAPSAAVALVDLPFEQQEAQLKEMLEQQKINGVKPTAREATRRANPDRVLKPKQKELRAALAAIREGTLEDPGSEALLRWVIGEIQPARIKGLTKALG